MKKRQNCLNCSWGTWKSYTETLKVFGKIRFDFELKIKKIPSKDLLFEGRNSVIIFIFSFQLSVYMSKELKK